MKKMIEYLERTPIVESACSKIGINRATYYRWMEEFPEFKTEVDKALTTGRSVVDDVAESHLVSGIKNGNMAAVKFWLSNNNERYKRKVEFTKNEMRPIPEEIIDQFFRLTYPKLYEEREPPTS